MSGPACGHPANALLPWYLNGSLRGEEESSVAAHLAACRVCAGELDELAELARAVSLHGVPEQSEADASERESPSPAASGPGPLPRPSPVLPARLGYGLAAALAVPAVLGAYWAYLGFPVGATPTGSPDRPAMGLRPTALLDLGAGPRRGEASLPAFVPSAGVDVVAISFSLLIDPDARYSLELHGPAGRILASEDAVRGCSPLGKCTCTLPAAILAQAGEHSLVVRERPPVGEERVYRYPFRVEGAAEPPQER